MADLNIYQRLNNVRKHVKYAKKDSTVQGYKAVTHDAITAIVRTHLVEHGVMIVPRQVSGYVHDTGTTTGKGIPIIRYEASYEIDFVNVDSPDDKVTVPIQSHALDQGDKAPGKALSYATKYALLKLLSIETGEEDESRYDQHVAQPDEDKVADHLAAMDSAESLDALQAAFTEAWTYAKGIRSAELQKTFLEAKDNHKKKYQEAS